MVQNPSITTEEVTKIVQNYLQDNSFRVLGISFTPLEELRGLMGAHFKTRIAIERDVNGKTHANALLLFSKSEPGGNDSVTAFTKAGNTFEKETFIYGTLFPLLRNHLVGTKEEVTRLLSTTSACYYVRPDLIIMEDLKEQGFFQLEKRTLLDTVQCLSVLETLARFHATAIIFEEKESAATGKLCRIGDMFPILKKDTFFKKEEGNMYTKVLEATVSKVSAMVDESLKYGKNSELNDLIQRKIESTMFSFIDLLHPADSQRNVVIHRDVWLNNTLFRRNSAGHLECRLVDLQMALYAPPLMDVLMYLHVNTTRDFRRLHEEAMVRRYHDMLQATLSRHGLDADRLLSWDDLLSARPQAKRAAVLLSAFYIPVMMIKMNDDFDMYDFVVRDHTEETVEAYRTDDYYRQRIDDVIEEIVELFIL